MSGGLVQIRLVKKACLAKQEWSTDAYIFLFVAIHYDIPVAKHPNDNNIESNHQRSTLWRSIHLETDITTCSHIDNSAFSESHSHVVKMQTLHGHSKQSGRSGFDHFSADQTCT